MMQRQQWWISVGNQAEGPHNREWIVEGLESGQVTADQLACPVGGGEWKPVRAWPEFMNYGGAPPPPQQAPPESHARSAPPNSLFTNPHLPPLGNAICVYAVVVSPVLWGIYEFSCCVSPDFFISSALPDTPEFKFDIASSLIEAAWSFVVAIAFFIGGLRLKSLRRSGTTILKSALWANFIFLVFFLVGFGVIYMVIPTGTPSEPTAAELLIGFFTLVVGITELVFQIVSLVWLHRIAPTLPLTAD